MSLATMTGAATAPTQLIHAKKATYAYRRFGHGAARSLLFLQHFVGTLDNWDPAVTDPLATGREVLLFDNAGVGEQMAAKKEKMTGKPVRERPSLIERGIEALVGPSPGTI